MKTELQAIYECILNGQIREISQLVQSALDSGEKPDTILNHALIPAMSETGRLFEEGEYFVPEMLIAAKTMQLGLDKLKPLLGESNIHSKGMIVIGTVKGDLHDIGKNLVCMLLEGAAFEIIDLGADVAPEKFVAAIEETGARLVALSALLTTTMPSMQLTIDALKAAGLRDQVKIMVGGAPLTQGYAEKIGADGYAPDASRAVALAKSLLA